MDSRHERHVAGSRQAPVHDAGSVDPNAVIAVIDDAEKLVGWKQLTTPQRVGAITTLISALGGLAVAIATAVS